MVYWDHFRAFLAVLRTGSLSRAAAQLDLTQPTLGRQLDALEEALGGTRLFIRSHRGLMPTDVALELQRHAESMEASALAMSRVASAPTEAIAGAVRITASEIVGTELLPSVLTDITVRHPALKIELTLSNAVDDLLLREADIALRMTAPKQKALIRRKVGDLAIGFFAHPRYLEVYGTPRDMSSLRRHRIVGFDRDSAQLQFLGDFDPGMRPEDFAIRVDNNVAQLAAVRAGLGIGLVQVGLAKRSGLLRVLPKTTATTLPLWVVMHEDQRGTARVRTLYEELAVGLEKLVD